MLTLTTLALAAVAGAPMGGTVWTVDDDGRADFADLPPAVAAALDGDTLLVEPGNYSPFVLTKGLAILGRSGAARPRILGESRIEAAPAFTLAGLELQELLVSDVPGRALIDDCEIGHTGEVDVGTVNASFAIARCDQVLITRTTCQGKSGDSSYIESPGLEVTESTLVLTGGWIAGGPGGEADIFNGWPGATGLEVGPDSEVLIAGASVFGGPGGPCIPFGGSSDGGDGILVEASSTVTMRGSSWDWLVRGGGCGIGSGGWAALGDGRLVLSGVQVVGSFTFGFDVVLPDPPEPYLELGGGSAPGDSRRLNLFGPAGQTAFVALAGAPALIETAGVVGLVWLDPAAIFLFEPVATIGQDAAATLLWPIPQDPALIGLALPLQAVFVKSDLTLFVTNPESLVVRF